ncbi:hypothetical protein Tco_1135806 [Tanacetum coccineum]
MQRSEATGKSPFESVTRRQPFTPYTLAASYEGSSQTAYKTMKEWHEQADLARASLDKAAKKVKKWADEKRRHVEFEVEDQEISRGWHDEDITSLDDAILELIKYESCRDSGFSDVKAFENSLKITGFGKEEEEVGEICVICHQEYKVGEKQVEDGIQALLS